LSDKIITIDIYDRRDANGSPLKIEEGDAIANAMQTFLLSKSGDYINNPDLGGILDVYDFKGLNRNFVEDASRITSILNENFSDKAFVSNVGIIPDFPLRLITIEVTITIIKNREEKKFSIYRKADIKYIQEPNYIDIPYEGENLVNFIQGELLEQPKTPLFYNDKIEAWVWNNYKLVNLSNNSDELQFLIELITSHNLGGEF
jgi:hypothetical protein